MYHPEALDPIVAFLGGIGIRVVVAEGLAEARDGFLPGVAIRGGALHVDPATLAGSGDLLHEAGHLAILPPRIRERIGPDAHVDMVAAIEAETRGEPPADPVLVAPYRQDEAMAQAWSYAAALAIGVDPDCVFFPGSYKQSEYEGTHPMRRWIESGTHFGPLALAQAGMTGFSGMLAIGRNNGLPPYPAMTRWVQG